MISTTPNLVDIYSVAAARRAKKMQSRQGHMVVECAVGMSMQLERIA